MPPSQLKQLKASLRDSGVIRPQQSKKKRRQDEKSGAKAHSRIQRQAALQQIRDQFNPFEIKTASRGAKFDVTTRDGSSKAGGQARPGVTKSLGEERRRATLLKEMNSRNKVGGIMDRRFGENDPSMTPEERAAERFARESQRKFRKESLFNLEEDDDEEMQLTHMGESLSFGGPKRSDDFAEDDLEAEQSSEDESGLKRKRVLAVDEVDDMEGLASYGNEDGEELPLRKKSKAEVMKEVIAKSKLYKHERQKAKEEDDDLRAELDQGLPDLFELLRGIKPAPKPEAPKDDFSSMDPARAALLKGKEKGETDAEYDKRLKQMAYDKRSQPTDRTKTEDEKAQEDAQRLRALEAERLRRMRGEEDSESEVEKADEELEDDEMPDDAKAFGLGNADLEAEARSELGVEDEDDFIIDEDLVETDSNANLSFIQSDEESEEESDSDQEDSDDDALMNEFADSTGNDTGATTISISANDVANSKLAYTYPCPESHDELLTLLKDVSENDTPVVIQRIRALYHPRLNAENKSKLARFSEILVEHVAYMADQGKRTSFGILENMLRHIHSMAKSNSEPVAHAFRNHLRKTAAEHPLNLSPGDLVILTGVMSIFPTSDHFHAVVTPANLCLSRYLGLSFITGLSDLATGAYLCTLSLQFQALAKRFMPEFINYCLNALSILSPSKIDQNLGPVFLREPKQPLRLTSASGTSIEKLNFWDIIRNDISPDSAEAFKASLLGIFVSLLESAAELWSNKSAFEEIFSPVQTVLKQLKKSTAKKLPSSMEQKITSTLEKINNLSSQAYLGRRPLLLHNHRPLAIKQSIPKFEEDFNPDRHYDPNRERAELNKLKAEHKRERKGAMRELRKDANFIARESLREKKERDAAYEKKYKRLIAEIQGEEGKEAKAYDRERKWRQGKK
ncbi:putative rRNA maturation protein [Talaromyces proteolyticus]|uniref:rRNA maturation protein n=1 Tax=Talaromyces proteolyticus TaxID=1131652 RepID=A0AAD4Q370_9EURO|nr:putative rRNA maturation protein [Talaromyces proteolyticus]KAH8701137.1 putative rRNA maturation protein [Talaromyces proteolyticus]